MLCLIGLAFFWIMINANNEAIFVAIITVRKISENWVGVGAGDGYNGLSAISRMSIVGSFIDDVNASHWAIQYHKIFNDARSQKARMFGLRADFLATALSCRKHKHTHWPFHCKAPLLCVAGCKFVAAGCYRRLGFGLWLVRVFCASFGGELLMWHGTVFLRYVSVCIMYHHVEMNDFRLKQQDRPWPWHPDVPVPQKTFLHPKPSLQLRAMVQSSKSTWVCP